MRTSFELKISAPYLSTAKEIAIREIASFMEIPEDEVLDKVNLELKVSYPEAETLEEINAAVGGPALVVTVYGSVKQSVSKPFGFDKV